MEIAEADASSETALAAPLRVGSDHHLPALILVAVVHVQLQLFAFVRLDEREEVFALVQDGVGADDVVAEGAQTGCLGGGRRVDLEDVPDVLVGSLEAAEPDGDA